MAAVDTPPAAPMALPAVLASPAAASPRVRTTSSTSSTRSEPLPGFGELAPARPPTAGTGETTVAVDGIPDVRLKVDAGPGCGGITWASGEVLARYLAYRKSVNPSYLANKRVLELGSGTGLVGIAAAMVQPQAEVWATDQACLVDLMRANAKLNGPPNLHVGELSWGTPIEHVPVDVDVVLAADCVYFEPAFPLLVTTLCDLAPVGKDIEILFAWKKRRKADKRFWQMLRKHFDSEYVDDDKPGAREVYQREGVNLLRLKRRK